MFGVICAYGVGLSAASLRREYALTALRHGATRVDVAVIGAGPAGALAAYALADRGASVVLLDRACFPRDKPCGGGLTQRTLHQLPFSVDPVVDHLPHRVSASVRNELRTLRPAPARGHDPEAKARCLPRRTRRRRRCRPARRSQGVLRGNRRFRHRRSTTAGNVRAELAIGADGANGVSAAAVGRPVRRTYCVAFEGNVPYEVTRAVATAGVLLLELRRRAWGLCMDLPEG